MSIDLMSAFSRGSFSLPVYFEIEREDEISLANTGVGSFVE